MVRDGFISVYGVLIDDYAEGNPLPCPNCGREGTAEVLRAIEYYPAGARLRCMACDYCVPEELTVFDFDGQRLIERAIDVWNEQYLLENDVTDPDDRKEQKESQE